MFSLTVHNLPCYTAMIRRNVGIRGFHRGELRKRVLSRTLSSRPSHQTCSLVWRSYLQTHYFNGALTALCCIHFCIVLAARSRVDNPRKFNFFVSKWILKLSLDSENIFAISYSLQRISSIINVLWTSCINLVINILRSFFYTHT